MISYEHEQCITVSHHWSGGYSVLFPLECSQPLTKLKTIASGSAQTIGNGSVKCAFQAYQSMNDFLVSLLTA